MTDRDPRLDALDLLVGEWTMVATFHAAEPAEGDAPVTFGWMAGERFLEQRWSVPVPEAPDGVAIIGLNPDGDSPFLQHYFDSRGVARVYRMSLDGRELRLWRDVADFSPLDFRQRYVGAVAEDGRRIDGAWDICFDGTTWEHDFSLSYVKA
jgi:hypothetical protein